MKRLLLWVAVPLMLLGAAMLIAGGYRCNRPVDCRDRGRYRTGRHRPGEADRGGTTVTLLA